MRSTHPAPLLLAQNPARPVPPKAGPAPKVKRMQITVQNPAKLLVALALAKGQLTKRQVELQNCKSCDQQVKQSLERSIPEVDNLINLIQEALK